MRLMKVAFVTIGVVLVVGAVVGCQSSSEGKPLTPEDRASMMDRSHPPEGYIKASRARLGGGSGPKGSGPVMPPAGGVPAGK